MWLVKYIITLFRVDSLPKFCPTSRIVRLFALGWDWGLYYARKHLVEVAKKPILAHIGSNAAHLYTMCKKPPHRYFSGFSQ
jgi:hypothetical protein